MASPSANVDSRRRKALLAWFAKHARDLPWRRDPTPYAVWVSEVMLQQTRVAVVRDAFARFMRRFPDLPSLARAREESVLQAWSGLGYYRRARMLHAAARVVMRDHAGELPRDPALLARLPGIGRYTQGAIRSLAYDEAAPIVDGNIERVFARWHGIADLIKTARAQRELWRLAEAWVVDGVAAGHAASALNQSLMELGAVVCTPRSPDCAACPVARCCAVRGRAEAFPVKAGREVPQRSRLLMALIRQRSRLLLVRRKVGAPASPLPDGLWELPHVEWPSGRKQPLRALERLLACPLEPAGDAATIRHSIMNWRLTLAVQPMTAQAVPSWPHGEARWFTQAQALRQAVSSATRKALEAAKRKPPRKRLPGRQ